MIRNARLTATNLARDHGGAGLRYGIVGLSGYALSVVVFAALVHAGLSPYAAVVPGFVANAAWNFTLNRLWSFPGSSSPWGHDLRRFLAVAFATLTANYIVLGFLHDVVGMTPVLAQALAILTVVPIGYIGQRYWAFAR